MWIDRKYLAAFAIQVDVIPREGLELFNQVNQVVLSTYLAMCIRNVLVLPVRKHDVSLIVGSALR